MHPSGTASPAGHPICERKAATSTWLGLNRAGVGALLAMAIGLLTLLPVPALAGSKEIEALAKSVLRDLQAPSIRQSREYCGIIYYTSAGELKAGPAKRGSRARCRARIPRDVYELVGTYHTHGGYLEGYDNEVPSITDLEGEVLSRTIGYVSTPGGRFWLVDGVRREIQLICGPKCMPWDPRFDDGNFGKIKSRYSAKQLYERVLLSRYGIEICEAGACGD